MLDIPLKCCKQGEHCIHPQGPILPRTPQYFSRNRNNKDGLQPLCKACVSVYMAQYYERNSERKRQYQNEYRQNNLEHVQEYDRQRAKLPHRKANAKRVLKNWRGKKSDKYLKQLERHKPIARLHYINNPEMYQAYRHARRAREISAPGHFTSEDIKTQFKMQKGRCWHCQKELNRNYHIDHLIPLSRGGSNDARNIVISCPECNRSKNDKLPHEWNGRLF